MDTSSIEQTPNELIDAALANEPIELPVDYRPLVDKRSKNEIVATRLAQNIGPLLGVPYPNGPFGEASWLRPLDEMTLQEIARGAPDPPPAARKGREVPSSGWEWVDDAVYGETPNSIGFATTNRFGPNPQAAVVLAGINRLLEPQTTVIDRAVRSSQFKALSTIERLQVYASMIFGVFQPQPLLVETGFSARIIQRMSTSPRWPVSPDLKGKRFARCEIPTVATAKGRPIQPFDLDLIDRTGANVAFGLPRRPPKSLVTDGLINTFRELADHTTWEYTGDPEARRHTVRALGDPSTLSSVFAEEVHPFTLWKRLPPL